MNKLYILLVFMSFSVFASSQIKLERTYPNSVAYADISDGEYVIYDMDVINNQCNIYDTDHNLIKTVPFILDANYNLYDIRFISRHTFNSDDNIELVYMSYTYVDNVTTPYFQYTTGVVDENGNSLLKVPGGMYFDLQESQGQNKLLIWVYDNSVWPYFKETQIYALNAPMTVGTKGPNVKSMAKQNLVYPNPASEHVSLQYSLPAGETTARLSVYNTAGQLVMQKPLSRNSNHILFNVKTYPPGLYNYTITLLNKQIVSQDKFLIK